MDAGRIRETEGASMIISLPDPPNGTCDVCGGPAIKWFNETSVRLCPKNECYQFHQQMWNEAYREEEE